MDESDFGIFDANLEVQNCSLMEVELFFSYKSDSGLQVSRKFPALVDYMRFHYQGTPILELRRYLIYTFLLVLRGLHGPLFDMGIAGSTGIVRASFYQFSNCSFFMMTSCCLFDPPILGGPGQCFANILDEGVKSERTWLQTFLLHLGEGLTSCIHITVKFAVALTGA